MPLFIFHLSISKTRNSLSVISALVDVSKDEEKAYIKAFGKKAFKEEMARQILLAKSNRASTRYLGNERIVSLNQHYWMMAAIVAVMWWFLKFDDTPGLSLV